MPIHLLIPGLKRLAAVLLLLPVAALAREGELPDGLYAEITTPKGVITCELDYDRAPLTVTSFVGLAEGTLGPEPRKPFFDGLTFHRVVPKFVIQGGDPLGTGDGGPDYSFPDEFSADLTHDAKGVLSMANDGPDTNGSQFFITLAPAPRLNFLYSVFGHTVAGMDVLDKVTQGDVMHVRILRIGPDAQLFQADDEAFSDLIAKASPYTASKEPGPKANFDDPDKLLETDPPRAQYFNFKLANVERMTGVKLYARVLATYPPAGPGDTQEAFTGRLAQKLGIRDDGVLAVYCADTDHWSLSVGSSMAERFIKAVSEPAKNDVEVPLEEAKRKFFTESTARQARYTAQAAATLANFLQTPAKRIKLSTDATVDELIAKLVR